MIDADTDANLPQDAVRLATLHRMKGLEFVRVLLAGVQGGKSPLKLDAADSTAPADRLLRDR